MEFRDEGIAMTTDQDQYFQESEGDAWFRRNATALEKSPARDPVIETLSLLDVNRLQGIRSVCDVGCSNGWRLTRLRSLLGGDCRLCGFDASKEAIESGRKRDAGLELEVGLVDSSPFAGPFDLVIVSFVLHWVDRRRLISAMADIDGLVAQDGYLIVSDFLPDRPCARPYHHRTDVRLYTYKQNYIASFTGMALYRCLSEITFAHDRGDAGVTPVTDQDRAVCALLHKDPNAYPVA
jgi:SAM-dependent methyltransferase